MALSSCRRGSRLRAVSGPNGSGRSFGGRRGPRPTGPAASRARRGRGRLLRCPTRAGLVSRVRRRAAELLNPFGKLLYVPVNFWFCLPEADGILFPECEAEGDPYLAKAIATLTLDGRSIDLRRWRTDAGRFPLELAQQNIWEFFLAGDLGLRPTTPRTASTWPGREVEHQARSGACLPPVPAAWASLGGRTPATRCPFGPWQQKTPFPGPLG
jgi:hypothetical protein